MQKVFIDGKEGTTGLKIFAVLANENVEVVALPDEYRKDYEARRECLNSCDLAVLCLPDAAAIEAAAMVENPSVKLLDCSTAHRASWTYGFPELSAKHEAEIKLSKRVANVGCHASGFIAQVYPLIKEGIVDRDYPFTCFSVTGYSGGGKKMIAEYSDASRAAEYDSPRQYGLNQKHKHLAEMTEICGLAYPPSFSPIVGDFYEGMCVTVPLHSRLMKKQLGTNELFEFFANYYAQANRITVTKADGGFYAANTLAGTDGMEITVAGNDERPLLLARLDNLGKGACGNAIQCIRLMLGL